MDGYEALLGTMIRARETEVLGETSLSDTLHVINPIGLLSSPGLCRERPATNHLCYDMALATVQWAVVVSSLPYENTVLFVANTNVLLKQRIQFIVPN
jgi:hypothetical protein